MTANFLQKQLLLALALICFSIHSRAQVGPLYDRIFQPDSITTKFDVHASSLFFLKNNEYLSTISPGFTQLGNQSEVGLSYKVSDKAIYAGVFYSYVYTNPLRSRWMPVLTCYLPVNSQLKFILGTLDGPGQHRLPQEVYGLDAFLTNPLEYGVQIKWQPSFLELDSWIDWQNNIIQNDTFQESFSQGNKLVVHLIKTPNWHISVPSTLVFYHNGGQIDASPLPTITNMYWSAGIDATHHIAAQTQFSIGFRHTQVRRDDDAIISNWQSGNSNTAYLNVQHNSLHTRLSYRTLNRYYAPYGDPVLTNFNILKPYYSEAKRQCVDLQVGYALIDTRNFKLNIGAEGYIFLSEHLFEYNYSIMGRFKL